MMAGYDVKRCTRSQTLIREARKEEDPTSFTKGFLYSDYQVIEYKPEDLMHPEKFIAAQQVLLKETMLNDCLTLAVNQLLRHRFFVQREQVQRLWKESLHWENKRVDAKKVDYGVSITAYREFFVKGNDVFSIVKVVRFEDKEPYASLKQFI